MNPNPSTDSWNEWHLVLLGPWGWPGRVFAFGVTVLVLVLAARALRREMALRRMVLLSLRALGLFAALVLFFQPAVQLRNVTRVPNHIAVLVDTSESMNIAERAGDKTRIQRVAQLLRKEQATLQTWRREHKVDFYTFGDRLLPASEESLTRAQGAQAHADGTRIREALAALRQRYERRDLAGVVLISDGLDNGRLQEALPATAVKEEGAAPSFDADTRDFLRALDAPVHTVAVGHKDLRDIAITRVLADEFAFARTPVQVEARLLVLGAEDDKGEDWVGRRLPVTLRRDGVPVMTVDVEILQGQKEYQVVFPFTPERVGKYLYEISVPVLAGEALSENNRRAFVLRVIRDKIRVVHVAGRPTWDVRFLRGLLKHDPNVDLVAFFILRSQSDVELGSQAETSLIPFPCEELFQQQLKSFDLVILQNFNYNAYCAQYLQPTIVPFIQEGGALMMVGGDLSFSSGGYYGSEVAQVLPVELSPESPYSFLGGLGLSGSSPAKDRVVTLEPFLPRLTNDGRSHVVTALRLDVKENEARWASLPQLEGANVVMRARQGGSVLLAHPSQKDADGKPLPILAVNEVGKGRTLALMADSTWRWGFGTAEGGGVAQNRGSAYQRFYEQAIRWLIRDPALRLLRVESTESEFARDQTVRIDLKALGPDYRPAKGVEIALSLHRLGQNAEGETAILNKTLKTQEDGEASVELEPQRPAGYKVIAKAQLGGRPQEEIEIFLVRGASRELEVVGAEDRLLAALSLSTSGQARQASQGLAGLSFHDPYLVKINKHQDVTLWDRTWVVLVAALCFGLNWTLRRRWGYA